MNYKKIITKILNSLGANRLNSGYTYIVYGMLMLLANDRRILSVVKSLYIEIADQYDTSWKCVEKNMHRVVKSVWISENDKMLNAIFQKTSIDKAPTNKEFLKGLCDFILTSVSNLDQEEILLTCPISQKYCKAFTDYCMNELQAYDFFK